MPLAAGSFPESDAAERKLKEVVAGIERRFALSDVREGPSASASPAAAEPADDLAASAAPGGEPTLGALSGARLDELKQHLIDLEYLEGSEAEIAADAPTPALRAGLDRFVAEAQSVLDPTLLAAIQPDQPGDPWVDEAAVEAGAAPPSAVALELLQRATSIDGETTLSRRPALGESGLTARILQFQLKRIGLYHQDVGAPVSGFTLNALTAFAAAFVPPGSDPGTASPIEQSEALGLIADIRLLIARLARQVGLTPILYRGPEGDDAEDFDDIQIRDGAFKTRGGLFSGLFGSGGSFDESWPEFSAPEDRLQSLQNTMALRFLQIALWALGFYGRRLDGIWNADCHSALLASLETYGVTRAEALRPIEGGFWAVNLSVLVKQVFGAAAVGDAEFEKQLALLDQETDETSAAAAGARESTAERGFFERIGDSIRSALRSGARVLSDVKSLLKSAVDGISRGVQWLAEGVQRLIGPVKNFFLFAYRSAREGVQMLVRSIRPFVHFVLRKPIVTTDEAGRPVVMTRFDLDRDGSVWIAQKAPPELVAEHSRLCRRLARALSTVMTFLGEGIDLLISALTGPLGWTRILVAALRKVITPGWLSLQSA